MGSQTPTLTERGLAYPREESNRNLFSFNKTPPINYTNMSSRIKQNFHEETEAMINKQINMEFYASYVYLSMSSFFNRDDQALHGFAKFFRKSSDEERDHGIKLMEYQAMKGAIELEKTVNASLLSLHSGAGEKNDAHLCDFLEANYLDEQVQGIKELADKITQIERAGPGLGLHIMDKEMS